MGADILSNVLERNAPAFEATKQVSIENGILQVIVARVHTHPPNISLESDFIKFDNKLPCQWHTQNELQELPNNGSSSFMK